MRASIALLLAGCTAGGGPIIQNPNNPVGQGCEAVAGPEYVEASSATFGINSLVIDQTSANVDSANVGACVRADGTGAVWVINDTFGDLYMMVVNETTTTGSLDVNNGLFIVDVVGFDPPIRFTGGDFFTQNWTVNSTTPFNATFQGVATNPDGHQIDISYIATANP